jgi:Leucine-rich repeat (LRR) protein
MAPGGDYGHEPRGTVSATLALRGARRETKAAAMLAALSEAAHNLTALHLYDNQFTSLTLPAGLTSLTSLTLATISSRASTCRRT